MAIRTDEPLTIPEVPQEEESGERRVSEPPEDAPAPLLHEDRVFVYQWPVRLWHWVMALAFFTLVVSGWLIAHPLASARGEAFDVHRMTWVRSIHFIAGYTFVVSFIARIYWAIVGNVHARQIFYLPLWQKKFWQQLWHEIRWYLFLEKRSHKYEGHNPVARVAMNIGFLGGAAMMIVTGLSLYGEELGPGSWASGMFGWVVSLVGGTQQLRTWHHVGFWVLILFTMAHLYAVAREEIMGRHSTLSTMMSGWRYFRDNPDDIGEEL